MGDRGRYCYHLRRRHEGRAFGHRSSVSGSACAAAGGTPLSQILWNGSATPKSHQSTRQVEAHHRASAWAGILAHVAPTRRGPVVRAMHEALERWLAYRDAVAEICGVRPDQQGEVAIAS